MIAILAIGETFVIITAGIDLSVGAVVGLLDASSSPCCLTPASRSGLVDPGHARGRARHRPVPRLRHRAHGPAAVHHHAGDPHLAARHRPADDQRRPRSRSPTTRSPAFSRGEFLGIPNLFWMVDPGRPCRPTSSCTTAAGAAICSRSAPTRRRPACPASTSSRMIYVAYIALGRVRCLRRRAAGGSRIGIGNATQAEGWELQAIASSVIGGTSLFGAVGSVHGPLLGAFILRPSTTAPTC